MMRREWWERRCGCGRCKGSHKVLGGMGDSVCRRNGWHCAVVGKKFGRAGDADALGFWDKKFVAAVVLHGGADVPCFFAMGRPALSCFGIFEDESTGSRRGKGRLVIVKHAVDLCMCR